MSCRYFVEIAWESCYSKEGETRFEFLDHNWFHHKEGGRECIRVMLWLCLSFGSQRVLSFRRGKGRY